MERVDLKDSRGTTFAKVLLGQHFWKMDASSGEYHQWRKVSKSDAIRCTPLGQEYGPHAFMFQRQSVRVL